MKSRVALVALALCALAFAPRPAGAQTQRPLTSEEFLQLIRQLPKKPSAKEEIIEEVRRRGLGFPLTAGLRSVVATKSGNDPDLRRTLEEADRRRADPSAASLPSEAEAGAAIELAREATLRAAGEMPDFVVKQLVARSYALGTTRNWKTEDRLVVAVSYREGEGEKYRLMAVNGVQGAATTDRESGSYMQAGGSTSTGEFVSVLADVFGEKAQAKFRAVDTGSIGARRAIVYEFAVEQPNSRQTIMAHGAEPIITAYRGRVWIDREKFRVLRFETQAVGIPTGYPVRAASRVVEYDWVTINERPYLLPSRSTVELTVQTPSQLFQSRNDIRFRNYQKYGTEIKVIEEDIIEDEPAGKKP